MNFKNQGQINIRKLINLSILIMAHNKTVQNPEYAFVPSNPKDLATPYKDWREVILANPRIKHTTIYTKPSSKTDATKKGLVPAVEYHSWYQSVVLDHIISFQAFK